jgi:hypothetical protein
VIRPLHSLVRDEELGAGGSAHASPRCHCRGRLRARLRGRRATPAVRGTDLLNAHETLHLHNVTFESLIDGSTRREEELVLPRSSLIAVSLTGPRGDPALRRWTHAHPVAIQLGEFLMGGYCHATHGEDPLASMLERPPMVPLTDAWLQHWPGGQRRRSWIGTMVFNRDLTDSIRVVAEEDLELGLLAPRPMSPS